MSELEALLVVAQEEIDQRDVVIQELVHFPKNKSITPPQMKEEYFLNIKEEDEEDALTEKKKGKAQNESEDIYDGDISEESFNKGCFKDHNSNFYLRNDEKQHKLFDQQKKTQ